MYPPRRPAILASNHCWLIALIAAEAGLCSFVCECASTHLLPRNGWRMDTKTYLKREKHCWVNMWNDNCNTYFLSPHQGGQKQVWQACRKSLKWLLHLWRSLCAWLTSAWLSPRNDIVPLPYRFKSILLMTRKLIWFKAGSWLKNHINWR